MKCKCLTSSLFSIKDSLKETKDLVSSLLSSKTSEGAFDLLNYNSYQKHFFYLGFWGFGAGCPGGVAAARIARGPLGARDARASAKSGGGRGDLAPFAEGAAPADFN